MKEKTRTPIIRSAQLVAIGTTVMLASATLFAPAGGQTTTGTKTKSSAAAQPSHNGQTATTSVTGRLLLVYGMSVNGPSTASLLFEADGGDHYQIVFTTKTTFPAEWRESDYSIKDIISTPGTSPPYIYLERDKSAKQEVGYADDGQVETLTPVVGRYSVRGKITTRAHGSSAGQITANGVTPLQ